MSEVGMRETRMKVEQVLHMNGGIGETSYSNNSLLQVKCSPKKNMARKINLKLIFLFISLISIHITKVYTTYNTVFYSICLTMKILYGTEKGSFFDKRNER